MKTMQNSVQKNLLNRFRNPQGFTLIECILCLALLGMLSYAAWPYLGTSNANVSLMAAAKKLEADLRYAQSLATTTGDVHGFETLTSPSGNAQDYRIYSKDSNGVKTTATSPHTHDEFSVDFSEIGEVSFGTAGSPQDYVIEFDSTGKPTTGGGTTITLTVEGGSGSSSKQISVAEETGSIDML